MLTILLSSSPLAVITIRPELPPSKWYPSNPPDWLISIGLLSSGPSTSLDHSIAFHHIVLNDLHPTAHSWCQSRVTSYRGEEGWHHSVSLSVKIIVRCVCIILTHHCNCDNTRGRVVIMWSRDPCLVVIHVAIVLAYNWWTLINRHMTAWSSDHSWPQNHDQSQRCNTLWCSMDLPVDWIATIRMRSWELGTIHHTAFNKTAKCTSLHGPKYTLMYTPDYNRLHTPILLDLCFQLSSRDAPKYTPGHALKDAPNCIWCHTPSLLDLCNHVCSQDALKHTPKHAPKYTLKRQDNLTTCSHICSWVLDPETGWVAGTRHLEAGGGRWVVVAEIMTSVDIMVWTLLLAHPLRWDLTMPHGYGVGNCRLTFCRKGGQLDLGESRALTQIA